MIQLQRVSFTVFYEDNCLKLRNFLFHKIGNMEDAEDLTQEVFAYCYQHYQSYDPSKSSQTTWLYMIANSRLKNYYRDRRVDADWEDVENTIPTDIISKVDDAYQLQYLRDRIAKALLQLPENQRAVIVKKFFLGKSHDEIAEEMGIKSGYSRVLLSRGIDKLNMLLQDLTNEGV